MNEKKHVVWLDVTRFLAMFFVFVSHAGDTFNWNAPAGLEERFQFWGSVWGSSARFCVPLFVMITGALLLPVKGDTSSFLRRRIGRVLVPFVVWSVLYNLLPWFVSLAGGSLETLRIFIPFAETKELSLSGCLPGLAQIPLNFNSLTTHLWYVYLLVGLYLFLPVLSAWFEKASERAKVGALALWGVTLLIPYVRRWLGAPWGECAWNEFGMFYYFSGFTGYLLLGSVLARMKTLSWTKTLAWAVPLFVIGYAVTLVGYEHVRAMKVPYGPLTELFWTFNSANAAAMTAAVFLVSKKFDRLPSGLARVLADINACGFGIYLAHYAFIGLVYACIVKPLDLPVSLQLPAAAVAAYLVVWGLIRLIRAVPGGKKITS